MGSTETKSPSDTMNHNDIIEKAKPCTDSRILDAVRKARDLFKIPEINVLMSNDVKCHMQFLNKGQHYIVINETRGISTFALYVFVYGSTMLGSTIEMHVRATLKALHKHLPVTWLNIVHLELMPGSPRSDNESLTGPIFEFFNEHNIGMEMTYCRFSGHNEQVLVITKFSTLIYFQSGTLNSMSGLSAADNLTQIAKNMKTFDNQPKFMCTVYPSAVVGDYTNAIKCGDLSRVSEITPAVIATCRASHR